MLNSKIIKSINRCVLVTLFLKSERLGHNLIHANIITNGVNAKNTSLSLIFKSYFSKT